MLKKFAIWLTGLVAWQLLFCGLSMGQQQPSNQPADSKIQQTRVPLPEQDPLPIMTITKTRIPPVIDGELQESEWKDATSATGFVDLQGRLTWDDTTVYLTYDDKNLYLAFRTVMPGRPRAKATARDSEVYKDDAIELFLQPDPEKPQRYFHFVGNSSGAIHDGIGKDTSWNGQWRFKNKVVDSGQTVGSIITWAKSIWSSEICIAFEQLGVSAPKEGSTWRINLCRDWDSERETKTWMTRWTSWSPSGGGFHNPRNFGWLHFSKDSPIVNAGGLGKHAREGNINLEARVSNITPRNYYLQGDLLVHIPGTGEQIIRQTTPLTVRPSREEVMTMKGSIDVSHSAPMECTFIVRDLTKKLDLYRRTFVLVPSPSFGLDTCLYYAEGFLEIACDISRLRKLPPSFSGTVKVYSKKGNRYVSSLPLEGLSNSNRTGRYRVDISKLSPGKYLLRAHLRDGERIIARRKSEFSIPEKPEWLGNKLGISDKVPLLWGPVKVKGDTVSVWGREYRFGDGPFPVQIINQGKPMLSSPIRLEIVTDKGLIRWETTRQDYLRKTDSSVSLGRTNRTPLVKMVSKVKVEFDGFIRVDLKLVPEQPMTIKRLTLKIPLRRENALYMNAKRLFLWLDKGFGWYAACLYEGAEGKDGDTFNIQNKWFWSAKGWRWTDKFMHYVWIGGDQAGLSVTFDSDRNWASSKYVDVVETENAKELTFSFVDSPHVLREPLEYTMAFHATPVKPLPKDPKKWRYVYMGGESPRGKEHLEMAVQYSMLRSPGWPQLKPKGKENVRRWHEGGVRLVPDFYSNQTSLKMPAFKIFGKSWESEPPYRFGKFATVCLRSSFGDFFLWGLNNLINEGLRGIYIDSSGILACKNAGHGCGYVDSKGRVRPTINLFEVREIYKRMSVLFRTRIPDSFILTHDMPISPLVSFVDAATQGEEWNNRRLKDYSLLTPDYFRASYMVYQQYGVPFVLYPGLCVRSYPKPIPFKDLVPLTLIHNTYPLPYHSSLFKPIWRIMDDWYTSSEWIPYWKNAHLVKSFTKEVKVNIYRKPDKRFLIVVANLGAACSGKLELNLANLGLRSKNVRIVNLRKKPPDVEMALTDSTLMVSLPRKSLRFFLLEEREPVN